ncbi:MAG: hypothetical protein F6K17_25275 [Okeania sp. SIO3C4]|nr:hypothetical protein [Okeania sp. SIO3C4]
MNHKKDEFEFNSYNYMGGNVDVSQELITQFLCKRLADDAECCLGSIPEEILRRDLPIEPPIVFFSCLQKRGSRGKSRFARTGVWGEKN